MEKIAACNYILIAAVLVCTILAIGGCASPDKEGFAIYLTRDDIAPHDLDILSHVAIAETPLIGMQDIVEYNAGTHEITLTTEAYERIRQLEVPVRGKSFAVCVDRAVIYTGAFWTPVSSMSYDGITIWQPFGVEETPVIRLALGYPAASFYGGSDPRSSPAVLDSLRQAGKLVAEPAISGTEMLPKSMKGYELYSWQQDGQWRFTLITGTNRNKTPGEILMHEDVTSEDGWVNIHAMGEEELKVILSRIPQGESVFWCEGMRLTEPDNAIKYPPEQLGNSIIEYAKQCGLALVLIGR